VLSLCDLAEMFLERGFEFIYEAVREWEARFAPLVADTLRAKRTGQAGRSWHVDENYVRVDGFNTYPYRAIDCATTTPIRVRSVRRWARRSCIAPIPI
jgi:putative transposase